VAYPQKLGNLTVFCVFLVVHIYSFIYS